MTWANALRKRGGVEVPTPWYDIGFTPVRGNLVVVMGAPGVGKSLFALNWVLNIQQPTLLVSLDTDLTTQSIRACCIMAGTNMDRVKSNLPLWANYLERKMKWCRIYDLGLDTQAVNDLVLAEKEYWGVAPSLVVIDNVSNIAGDTSYESYRNTFVGLQKVARLQDTVVLALHHVRREAKVGPLSMQSGQYAGEQEAEVVLGLYRPSGDQLAVQILKNRNGKADPLGGYFKTLTMHHDSLRLTRSEADYIVEELSANG